MKTVDTNICHYNLLEPVFELYIEKIVVSMPRRFMCPSQDNIYLLCTHAMNIRYFV